MDHLRREELPIKRHTPDQIIFKLRETEVALAHGKRVLDVCRQLGVFEQTYYRWRNEYGGLKTCQARQLKLLERENSKLKQLVAELSLDKKFLSKT